MLTGTGIFSPPDPHSLALRCLVNGESVQSSNTDQMIFKTEALVSWVSKYVLLCAFFPCPWWLCWVFFPSFYSQRHFVSYKTNFLYPSTETLDDATICGLRKYANQCLMLFFMLLRHQMAEMTCFIWDPAGLSQAGALNLRLMAGKLLHLSADLMLTYAQSSCLRVHPHFKLA